MSGAVLRRTVCREADFRDAVLAGADVTGTIFERALLAGAETGRLDFSSCNMKGVER